MNHIYLDHAAATEMYGAVQTKLQNFLDSDLYGNPSSVHEMGRKSRNILDQARIDASKIFECQLDEIFFTSGATEAMGLGIVGGYLGPRSEKREERKVLVSPLVHSCVWGAVGFLEQNFGVEVETLPITDEGFLDLKKIDEKLLGSAAMIVVEHGNSEIGVVQPVAKLGKMLDKLEEEKPLLIVDCAASVVCEKISLEYQKCDMLVISGEKFGAPAGSGLLLKRKDVKLQPLVNGSQEFGFRGGTENVFGIYGLVEALKQKESRRGAERESLKALHAYFRSEFVKRFPDYEVTTPEKDFLPHIFHFRLPEEKAEVFVQRADLAGFCISAGSACSSGAITGSRALQNLGLSEDESRRGVRVSFGVETTTEELEQFLDWI